MTVTNENRSVTYNGDGSTTVFPVANDGVIYFLQPTDLLVTLIDADGVDHVQALTTDYTVSGAGNADGGSVTMLTAPAAGERLRIERWVDILQPTNYPENTKFPAASHERALDRLTMIDQQQQGEIDRAPKFSETSGYKNVELPAPENGKGIKFDAETGNYINTTFDPDQAQADAEAAKEAAEAAQEGAEEALASFNEKYIGAFANDAAATAAAGGSPVIGALYWNTGNEILRIWTGSVWSDAGTGDMLKSEYDPGDRGGNAFDGAPVSTAADLTLLSPSIFTSARLTGSGREGPFVWRDGDYSARVSADPDQYQYVESSEVASTQGAWVLEGTSRSTSLVYADKNADLNWSFGAAGGWFSDYDCGSGIVFRMQQSENLEATGGTGAIREALTIHHIDRDTTNYSTAQRRTIANGVRILASGAFDGTQWQGQTKDIVGLDAHAVGRITGWDDRGVSGIAAGAVQYGSGICSNEFAVQNPAAANEQSVSMAAVQAIIEARKGAADDAHRYRGVLVTNGQGYAISAGVDLVSVDGGGALDGSYNVGIGMNLAKVNHAAIKMPFAGAGRGVIEYDANDFSNFDAGADKFDWVIGGNFALSVNASAMAVGSSASAATARLVLPESNGTYAHLRLTPGGVPTNPQNGDMWFDGQLRIMISGSVRTVSTS